MDSGGAYDECRGMQRNMRAPKNRSRHAAARARSGLRNERVVAFCLEADSRNAEVVDLLCPQSTGRLPEAGYLLAEVVMTASASSMSATIPANAYTR